VLVIDETGTQLGTMNTNEAVKLATEKELDLVEVAAASRPPVCRILDYGKFRYHNTRKERESKKDLKSKSSNVLKEVRFKPRIGEHDKMAKIRKVQSLLANGSKVKVSVMFRGREITHPETGMAVLKSVADEIANQAAMDKRPGFEGRFLTMTLSPVKNKVSSTITDN
jgi:translation initiation factor IF-3